MQGDYEKFINTYQKGMNKKTLGNLLRKDQDKLKRIETEQLENRWANYLNDSDSLAPMSLLDKEEDSYKRPNRYSRMKDIESLLNNRHGGKTVYDRELQRMKDSRSSIKQFIES